MAEAYITRGLEAGNTAMEGFDKGSETVAGELAKFRERQIAEANRIAAKTVGTAKSTVTVMGGGGLIAAALATVFSLLIARSIIHPVSTMKSTMVEIGKTGGFTRRIGIEGKDEVGQAARSFNDMIGNLQTTLHELYDGIDRVFDASRARSTSSHQVATGSAPQSEAASAMASTVEQFTVNINHVSESAREALLLSRKSGELSGQGSITPPPK